MSCIQNIFTASKSRRLRMKSIINHLLEGKNSRPINLDLYWEESKDEKPLVVFAHGFKGFKDWGHWKQIAMAFANAGYCFVKFNFSHNGTTTVDPLNFVDLEAFGQNNYTKELDDLQTVINWLLQANELKDEINWRADKMTLIGHSRGGPIVLIGAKENACVQQVITWASVHELDYAWQKNPAQLPLWKKAGVYHIMNGRTKQNMPLYYQLFENYQEHVSRLSIKKTLKEFNKPYLIIHGTNDLAVSSKAAAYLAEYATNGNLVLIDGANHVFGGTHPFEEEELPIHSKELVQKSLDFLRQENEK